MREGDQFSLVFFSSSVRLPSSNIRSQPFFRGTNTCHQPLHKLKKKFIRQLSYTTPRGPIARKCWGEIDTAERNSLRPLHANAFDLLPNFTCPARNGRSGMRRHEMWRHHFVTGTAKIITEIFLELIFSKKL